MVFGLFKKKEEEIPEDIGFETPPTLANPTGFSSAPNLPPLPGAGPNAPQAPTPNPPFPNLPASTQPASQYTPPYAPKAPAYNPDLENQVKLLQTKVESITVQLNTLSQKLDYIINMLRSQGRF